MTLPLLMLELIPGIGQAAGLMIGGEKGERIVKQSKSLGKIIGGAAGLTKAFKSSSIGDVTKKDPLSFNEALTINKDGALSGIDYEKFNFDKALSDKGMKAFSTDIKNSDTIFSFNEGLKIGDISEIDYGKNNFDEYPNYFN